MTAEVRGSQDNGPPVKSWVRDYFESICIAVVFALFVRTFVVQAFKIPSGSMEDNLLIGDHILVDKFSLGPHAPWMAGWLPYRDLKREDVFVFKYPKDPNRDFIKRVVGIGGDEMEVRGAEVVRNGEVLNEPYVFIKPPPGSRGSREEIAWRQSRDKMPALALRSGQYFAMGDNRLNSDDSRYWGTVPGANVKGRALLVYWSFQVPESCKIVEVEGNASVGERLRCLGYTLVHFFDKSRWRRTGRVIH